MHNGQTVIRPGEIRYNDPCSYRRTTLSDGLTVRYDAGSFSVASITSYQYSDDEMILDQDFLPLSYFTLKQARTEHALTEDIVFRSHEQGAYRWLLGAFGFYRHGTMNAPVHFKQTGIEELILKNANEHDPQYTYDAWDNDELLLGSRFRNPSAGGALYHESNYTAGRWRFTAGLRFDYEHTRLRYRSSTQTGYTATNRVSGTTGHYPLSIDIRNTLKRNFTEVLPKFSVLYAFDEIHNLYVSVAKGYKAGGFNTQMFSDVLQQKMMNEMGFGTVYDADKVVSYEPEYSWNYELGGHFSCMEGAVRGDFALFYIDCRDQQLTVFPEGTTTGRMMTNAGRTRSFGGELSLQVSPWQNLDIMRPTDTQMPNSSVITTGKPITRATTCPTRRSIRCPQMGRGRSPRGCRGSGTSSCRPVSAARGASGGTRRIRSRSPFMRWPKPPCVSNRNTIRSTYGDATSRTRVTTYFISSPSATNSYSADVPGHSA